MVEAILPYSTKANSVRMIRNRAMDNQTYSSSVIPFGYVGVKKEEKVVFPDGTVYFVLMASSELIILRSKSLSVGSSITINVSLLSLT
jgi:hypothetical protein